GTRLGLPDPRPPLSPRQGTTQPTRMATHPLHATRRARTPRRRAPRDPQHHPPPPLPALAHLGTQGTAPRPLPGRDPADAPPISTAGAPPRCAAASPPSPTWYAASVNTSTRSPPPSNSGCPTLASKASTHPTHPTPRLRHPRH